MKRSIFTLDNVLDWNEMLLNIPLVKRDIYYTSEYYSLYEKCGHGKSNCFVYEENGDVALYPFLKNPLPYNVEGFDIQGAYGYNGVVYSNDSENFKLNFHNAFKEYCNETNIVAEFTRFNPVIENSEFSEGYLDVVFDRNTVVLDVDQSIDDIWNNSFSSKNRNMIRKAIKLGVVVTKERSERAFETFYELYSATMRDLSALDFYFFSKSYFLNIQKTIKEAFVYEARLDNSVIGSILIFEYGNYSHYHLSARNRAYSKVAANNLLLFEAVKDAKENECKFFHFGGGDGSETDFLLKFKENFSKEKRQFKIGKKIHNQKVYDKVIEVWRKENNITLEKESNRILRYRDN